MLKADTLSEPTLVTQAKRPEGWTATKRRSVPIVNGESGTVENAGVTGFEAQGRHGAIEVVDDEQEPPRRIGVEAERPLPTCAGTWRPDRPLELGPQDGGSREAPVSWAAAPGAEAVVAGGRLVTGWHPWRGDILRAELPGNRFRVENTIEDLDRPRGMVLRVRGRRPVLLASARGQAGMVASVPRLVGLVDIRGAAWITLEGIGFPETRAGLNFLHEGVDDAGAMAPRPGWTGLAPSPSGPAGRRATGRSSRAPAIRSLDRGAGAVYRASMGRRLALDALALPPTPRVPSFEVLEHPRLISEVTGIDPFARPLDASPRACEALGVDWIVDIPRSTSRFAPGEEVRELGGGMRVTEWRRSGSRWAGEPGFAGIEDVLRFRALEDDRGAAADVRAAVRRCMDLGRGCPEFLIKVAGDIFHNVPLENALAYTRAKRELGTRS
jgi:hypothetical protein